jgi:hypothetical protein
MDRKFPFIIPVPKAVFLDLRALCVMPQGKFKAKALSRDLGEEADKRV